MPYLYITRCLFIILVLITSISSHLQAQSKKADTIYKLDKTLLEVYVDEVGEEDILYRKTTDTKSPLYAIPKKEVWKIVWSNGDVEEITAMPVVAQKPASRPAQTQPVRQTEAKRQSVEPTQAEEKSVVPTASNGKVFAGLRAGVGVGMIAAPSTELLRSGVNLAYNSGLTLGYRLLPALTFQADVLYTGLAYQIDVPEGLDDIERISGQQQNLVIPLTLTYYKNISTIKLGLTLGGFGNMQLGSGYSKVTYTDEPSETFKNCSTCSDTFSYGVVGGVSAILVERAGFSLFVDARWYHSLADNAAYKVAESGVRMNSGILGAGLVYNLPY